MADVVILSGQQDRLRIVRPDRSDSIESQSSTMSSPSSSGSTGSCPSPISEDSGVGLSSQSSLQTQEISRIALEVAHDIVQRSGRAGKVGYRGFNKPSSTVCTMRRLVDRVLDRHSILLKGMVNKTLDNPDPEIETTNAEASMVLIAVADEMFADGKKSWGRVIALYAFVARIAQHLRVQGNRQDELNDLPHELADYITEHLGHWIEEQGGWEKLDRQFPEQTDWESKLFKGLLVTGVGLGVLAGFFALK